MVETACGHLIEYCGVPFVELGLAVTCCVAFCGLFGSVVGAVFAYYACRMEVKK